MSNLPSAFKNPKGEAEYMAAYENTMRLWSVPWEAMDIPSRFGSTHLVACGPEEAPPLVLLHQSLAALKEYVEHNEAVDTNVDLALTA